MKQFQDLTEAQRILFNDIEHAISGHISRMPVKSVIDVLGTLINKWKEFGKKGIK